MMMFRTLRYRLAAVLGVAFALAATDRALAQSQPIPPERYSVDERGVDMVTGQLHYSTTEVVIGNPGSGGLAYGRISLWLGWRDIAMGGLSCEVNACLVSLSGVSEPFTRSGTTFTSDDGRGATLVASGLNYLFTASEGTQVLLVPVVGDNPYEVNVALISEITEPNGAKTTYHYATLTPAFQRIQAITNSFGYQIHYSYDAATTDVVSKVVGLNMAVDYCDPAATECTDLTRVWPSVTYARSAAPAGGTYEYATDQGGRDRLYLLDTLGQLSAINLEGESQYRLAVARDEYSRVVLAEGVTGRWTYAYDDSYPSLVVVTSAGPNSQSTQVVAARAAGLVRTVTTALSAGWIYTYDTENRLKTATNPERDFVEYFYDGRGNVTKVIRHPKPGSTLADIVTEASYPATCSNPVICNRPLWTKDALGQVTDYVWNTSHGGPEAVILPAPSAGSGVVRPEMRFGYGNVHARYHDTATTFANGPTITLPVSTSACAVGAAPACIGTVDETRSTISYDATGAPTNLLPISTTLASGTGAPGMTTAMTYTPNGDVEQVDGPQTADLVRYRYDLNRQTIGVVGPDPDGSGPLLNRAQKFRFRDDGLVDFVFVGTTPGYTDTDWTAFAVLQQQGAIYDDFGRPVVATQETAAGIALVVNHLTYDASGRPECLALRMQPGAVNSLPPSACQPMAVSQYGADRITQTVYDADSRPSLTIAGIGTPDQIVESLTYTANGRLSSLTDGASNASTLTYDGFDRLDRLNYPNPTGGGTSSTDFEAYVYDATSNVTSARTRGGTTFASTYDFLNRVTSVGSTAADTRSSTYDNLGRVTAVAMAGATPAATTSWAYDALGRQLSETQTGYATTTVSYEYDSGGRRTRINWPDGFFATYAWDHANELVGVAQNGVQALAVMAYDNLGRLTTTQRTNGVTSAYGYDGISRLTGLSHDPVGTSQDVVFGYAYDPASQIVARSVSNGTYAAAAGVATTTYADNGRNQVTAVDTTAIAYDADQNLTSAPGGAYGFNTRNQLTTANAVTLVYDPLGRLARTSVGSTAQRFLYDGVQAIAEYDAAGAMTARYVPGAGLDDIVAAYASSGTTSRKWLLADERGSVVGLADATGAVTTVNVYDEYGMPGSSNSGRFQYTGQMWLDGTGVYHYRARAYAPQLGRFLQTDPIGYAAGANLYGYVGGDPVNFRDPLGSDRIYYSCLIGSRSEIIGGEIVVTAIIGECSIDLPDGQDFVDAFNNFIGSTGEAICSAANRAPSDASVQASLGFTAIAGIGLSDTVQITAFRNETGGVTIRLQESGYDGWGFGMNAGVSLGARWGPSNEFLVAAPDLRDLLNLIPDTQPSLGFETDLRSFNGTFASGVPLAITRPVHTASRTIADVQTCN